VSTIVLDPLGARRCTHLLRDTALSRSPAGELQLRCRCGGRRDPSGCPGRPQHRGAGRASGARRLPLRTDRRRAHCASARDHATVDFALTRSRRTRRRSTSSTNHPAPHQADPKQWPDDRARGGRRSSRRLSRRANERIALTRVSSPHGWNHTLYDEPEVHATVIHALSSNYA